jgi:hypothetical protein
MKFIYLIIPLIALSCLCSACMGTGKTDAAAAKQVMTEMKDQYKDKVKDIKVFRDKLQIALPKDMSPLEKSQIFMDAATRWWLAYPEGKKPRFKLYLWAYDDVISDDDIGSLTMTQGTGGPRIIGEPGIYTLRDVK